MLKRIAAVLRWVRSRLSVMLLRLKGCDVDWSVHIDATARVEPSGGRISIGPRTSIDCGVIIRGVGGHVVIGSDCAVNAYSVLYGSGGINIGNGVMMGSHVSIYASNHIFSSRREPMYAQGLEALGITVADDVWIGTGARILDGVEIGPGSILAAGAVVTKSVAPFSINGGVPSRVIGSRG